MAFDCKNFVLRLLCLKDERPKFYRGDDFELAEEAAGEGCAGGHAGDHYGDVELDHAGECSVQLLALVDVAESGDNSLENAYSPGIPKRIRVP